MRNIEVLKERAENMRRKPTFHEAKFKERLELAGLHYKTQWIIGNYIVDFMVGNKIIEIDGYSHFEAEQAQYDKQRTSYLKGLGYTVIRVRNEHVVSFDMNRLKTSGKFIPHNGLSKKQRAIKERRAAAKEYDEKHPFKPLPFTPYTKEQKAEIEARLKQKRA